MDVEKKVEVVFLPMHLMGHFKSMVEFAKLLLHHHHQNKFSITILIIPSLEPSPQISSYISSVAASGVQVSVHELPSMHPRDFDSKFFLTTLLDFYKTHVKSVLEDILLLKPIAAIIADFFLVDVVDVANEIGVPFYMYFTGSATSLGLMLNVPKLDSIFPKDTDINYELQQCTTMIELPGFTNSLPHTVLPYPFPVRKSEELIWTRYVEICGRFPEVKGFIINTYCELEPSLVKAFEDGRFLPDRPTPPVYPVGPVLSLESSSESTMQTQHQHECIRWLDGQPPKSVVFLCFGSMGSFTLNQAREIAIGLEKSKQRFLWALRSRPLSIPQSQPFTDLVDAVLDEILPSGFLERTKTKGMVWPSLAPQAEILAHSAIGGFVTHCGWNSCLESLWFGVPMLAWPMYAEQHLNAFELVKEIGVALELKMDHKKEGNWVAAEEIERGVRCLMEQGCCEENMKVRFVAMEMKEKGRKALEEGGSSVMSIEKLARSLIN